MKTFRYKDFDIFCEAKGNRTGFVHRAVLTKGNSLCVHKKVQYYNRTWECYRFQSAILLVIEGAIKERKMAIKESVKAELGVNDMRTSRAKELHSSICTKDLLLTELKDAHNHFSSGYE